MNQKDQEQLHKDIERAFDFYSHKFNWPEYYKGWVAGPTFIVWAPEYKRKERDKVYKDQGEWAEHVKMSTQSLIRYAPDPNGYSLDGQRQKHGDKCSHRYIRNSQGEPIAELAFPLARLIYKYKADRFALTEGGIFYAYGDQGRAADPGVIGVFRVKETTCQT